MAIKLGDNTTILGGGAGGPGIGIGIIVRDSNQKRVPSSFFPQFSTSPITRLSGLSIVKNYPIRDAVLSGLVALVNGVELHCPPLPTLVHRVALRHRQNFSAQQITLHLFIHHDNRRPISNCGEWDPDRGEEEQGSVQRSSMSMRAGICFGTQV